MGTLNTFQFVTANGFFKGPNGDIGWHHVGEEHSRFASESLSAGNTLLFGRVTYEMMASYWPTPMARENDPVVANGMNEAEKIVFSRSLEKATWANSRVVSGNLGEEVRRLKASGKNLTLLGSGSILTQLAELGLVDEFQIMVNPIALSEGTPLFHGLKKKKLDLELTGTRAFSTGVVVLTYRPAGMG